MRKVLFVAAFIASATAANATTWVATCTDGKNVQYVQTIKGAGYLYMKTGKDYYQAARLSQSFDSETVICGTVVGNDAAAGGPPVSQICINRSRHVVSLKYRNPTAAKAEVQDAGDYCAADIMERATNLKEH